MKISYESLGTFSPTRITPQGVPIYEQEEAFQGMEKAGQLAAALLDFIGPFVQEGVTTNTLNDLCHTFVGDHKAISAPLGYHGFPKSICTSVNEVVCHGIPNDIPLKKGDLLNIDVGVIVDGWYGDTSRMYVIQSYPSVQAQKLVEVTEKSLEMAIALVRPGCFLGDIGHVIQTFVESHGFSVVRDYCGHGVGRSFHCAPEVAHFGRPNTGIPLEKGMFFTIEPMVNMGKHSTKVLRDGWTVVTRDRSLSAQKEHSLGVTDAGCVIFTRSRTSSQNPKEIPVGTQGNPNEMLKD